MKTLVFNKTYQLLAFATLTLVFLVNPVQAKSTSCTTQRTGYHSKPTLVVHTRENCQRVEFSALEQEAGKNQKATPTHYLTPGKTGYNHHNRS